MARASDPAAFARLRELFHAAVDLPPNEQARFVATLAPDDRTYLAELAELLAANLQTGNDPVAGFAETLRGAQASTDLAGQRLGSWQLESLIGQGGMGAVYLAARADGVVQQRAAVKLVHPALASPSLHQRFQTERQVLANLEHPGIARLLDAGASAEGHPYLVMEYVEGADIERHCLERKLSLDQRLTLFRGVCAAVEYAHRNLVVHSDIKPGNVLVTADGQVKLLDFGIAKLLSAPGQDVTHSGAVRFTPAFASPEQLAGQPVTTATDVYSLGVLLYRLLTGRHPYSLVGLPLPGVARVITEEKPRPPSSAVLDASKTEDSNELDPDLSLRPPLPPRPLARALGGDLDTIILTALRKEPDRRYASVAAMAEDIRRHQEGLPVLARGDSFRYRAGKFLQRNRLASVATAIAIASLITGAAVSIWQAREATRERDRARIQAHHAEEMNRLLRSVLTSADPIRGEGRDVKVAALLAGASSRLGTELAAQPGLEGNLRETLGETYRNLGLAVEAESEFQRAMTLHAKAGDDLGAARARSLLAVARREQGKFAAAETDLREALKVLRRENSRFETTQALDALLVTLRHEGKHEEAIVAGQEAAMLLRTQFPNERAMLASTLNNLALVFGEQGNFSEAEKLHRQSITLIRAERGTRHPQTAEAVANLAGVLDMQGRLAEAEPLYREAMQTQEALLTEEHPDFLRTLTSYANLLWLMRRPSEAEPHARRARDVATRALGSEHPLAAYAENILGGILLDVNKPEEAEPVIRSALTKRRKMLPAGHWLIASAQSNLGAALLELGRFEEASRELNEAHKTLLADRGPNHEKTKLTADRLARLNARRTAAR